LKKNTVASEAIYVWKLTVTGITSLPVPKYRHSSRKISRLFAEFVAPFSLVTTSQLEEEGPALEPKAAGAAFAGVHICKGLKKVFCVLKDAGINDLVERLRISRF
jgi:hypothetical protein